MKDSKFDYDSFEKKAIKELLALKTFTPVIGSPVLSFIIVPEIS